MTGISRTLLNGLLAVALLTGGLPTWAGNAMDEHPMVAAEADSGEHNNADCHSDSAPVDAVGDEPEHECCESGEICEHDDCRCLCPALSLVLPVRATATAWSAPASPTWSSTPPSPTRIITTLLRPPRA